MITLIIGDHCIRLLIQPHVRESYFGTSAEALTRKTTVMQKLLAIIVSILTLEACSTGHTSVKPSSNTLPRRDSTLSDLKLDSWNPHHTSGTYHYLIIDSSTVSLSNDTTSHVVPIESRMIYSLSLSERGELFDITAHVDSLSITSQLPGKNTHDTSQTSNFHTSISRQGHSTIFLQPEKIACTATTASASSRLDELIVSLPPISLKTGDKWTDTVSSISCHGKIPLIQQAVRDYELLDISSCLQQDAVKVRRTISETFTGSSAEDKNHLSASGSGTATATLCLQRKSGTILKSDADSRLDLVVITTRGSFPFTQNVHTHVEIR
jgi:hypothetical protein